MSTKPTVFSVALQRDGISLPWGFRLSGGCDVDHPLVVTKVTIGSPSDGILRAGDIIKKIGSYDARDLRHNDALSLFKNAGSNIIVVVERETLIDRAEDHPSRNALPFIPQPPIAGGVATPFTVAGLPTFERARQHPTNNLCRFPPALIEPTNSDRLSSLSPHQFEVDQETQSVLEQPYRTTPLVLPGAKVSKDPAPTMSYLRHHPNPMMRSGPAHYEWVPIDIAKKQQLADSMLDRVMGNEVKTGNKKVVSKLYNSPIGLYSEQNIANTINSQAGFTPNGGAVVYNPPNNRLRKTVVYDPSKSETYKALQEAELGNHYVQEVSAPVTPRVFSPTKAPNKKLAAPSSYNPNRASPQPHHTAPHSKLDYGVSPEEIHQSHSFKRLMNMVMTDY